MSLSQYIGLRSFVDIETIDKAGLNGSDVISKLQPLSKPSLLIKRSHWLALRPFHRYI